MLITNRFIFKTFEIGVSIWDVTYKKSAGTNLKLFAPKFAWKELKLYYVDLLEKMLGIWRKWEKLLSSEKVVNNNNHVFFSSGLSVCFYLRVAEISKLIKIETFSLIYSQIFPNCNMWGCKKKKKVFIYLLDGFLNLKLIFFFSWFEETFCLSSLHLRTSSCRPIRLLRRKKRLLCVCFSSIYSRM